MRIHWFSSAQQLLQEDWLHLQVTPEWEQATMDINAPAGTASVYIVIADDTGSVGDVIYFDDLVVKEILEP